MARKSTGKRLRFEVFKRDHFTCQYCGAQPPDVVLVIDHIDPDALGGPTTIDNLITACEPCNQGKADRPLEAKQVRTDADLLYLETQQEIAELRRFQAAKAERDAVLQEVVESLQETWSETADTDWVPSDRLIRQLLGRYDPTVVESALVDVAYKVGTGYLSGRGSRWIAYLYAVARNLAAEGEGE
jgi:hypothetical protein